MTKLLVAALLLAGCTEDKPQVDHARPPEGVANRTAMDLYCTLPDGEVTRISTVMGPTACADFGATGDGLKPAWWDDSQQQMGQTAARKR